MDKTLTEQEIALLRRKLDLLLRTGQLLVESAADTNRVVRNLNRVAAYLGLPEEKQSGHGLQSNGKGQDQHGRNHGNEALGQTVHGLLEGYQSSAHIVYNGK